MRWGGLLGMIGGVIWTTAWILNGLTEDGSRAVLGLSEGGYRRVTNAALVLFMVGLAGFHKRQSCRSGKFGTTGLIVTLTGCVLMILGNGLEYGFIGSIPSGERPGMEIGWALFLLGLIFVVPTGLVLFGVGVLKADVLSSWRRFAPLIVGFISFLGTFVGIAQMMSGGDTISERWLTTTIFSLGVGWVLMGYAIWSDTQDRLNQDSWKPSN